MSSKMTVLVTAEDCDKAARKLRDLVTTIEFTMISIITGLMLFPWIDYASPLIHELRFEYWVYLVATLVAILFYWAALINHALSFVAWPIDIIHNLIYLLFFPVLGVTVHFMGDPGIYYPMFVVAMTLAVTLTAYDLSLIRSRQREAEGAAAGLLAAAYERQLTLVRLVIPAFAATALFAILITAFPDFFIGQHMHVLLGVCLVLMSAFFLVRECVELNKMRSKILLRTAEEIARERASKARQVQAEAAGRAV